MSSSSSHASISQRLTSTSALLLERSRILSLGLKPSPSSTSQVVRNLTTLKSELSRAYDAALIESDGLRVGVKKGKKAQGEVLNGLEELGRRYDGLVDMLGEDDVGRERAKTLARETKRWVKTFQSRFVIDAQARCECRTDDSPTTARPSCSDH